MCGRGSVVLALWGQLPAVPSEEHSRLTILDFRIVVPFKPQFCSVPVKPEMQHSLVCLRQGLGGGIGEGCSEGASPGTGHPPESAGPSESSEFGPQHCPAWAAFVHVASPALGLPLCLGSRGSFLSLSRCSRASVSGALLLLNWDLSCGGHCPWCLSLRVW